MTRHYVWQYAAPSLARRLPLCGLASHRTDGVVEARPPFGGFRGVDGDGAALARPIQIWRRHCLRDCTRWPRGDRVSTRCQRRDGEKSKKAWAAPHRPPGEGTMTGLVARLARAARGFAAASTRRVPAVFHENNPTIVDNAAAFETEQTLSRTPNLARADAGTGRHYSDDPSQLVARRAQQD
jgi:hypothetical protein